MDFLSEGIAWLLAFFYQLVPSFGVAITLLTLAVMVVLTPLTLKGTRSMMAMQQLQPELKKLQNQYKDDREKLNEELLKFYRENEINPLGGCLPLLVQLPVFLVLYQVLNGLTRRTSDLGSEGGWVLGQIGLGESPTEPPTSVTERTFDPAFLDSESSMYDALSGETEMNFLGIDLAESASVALRESVVHAIPYFVLILLVGLTGWYQQRQIQGRNPGAMNPQQQMIMKFLPIMLPVISFALPGGLVLYFLVSNTYRVGQQAWITRTMYGPDGPIQLTKAEPGDGDGGDKGGSSGGDGDGPGRGDGGDKGGSSGGEDDGHPRGGAGGDGAKKGKKRGSDRSGEAAATDGGSSRSNGGRRAKDRGSRETSGSDRPASKRTTPKKDAGGRSGRGSKGKKKTYTSDPKRKRGEPEVAPRARKPKRKS